MHRHFAADLQRKQQSIQNFIRLTHDVACRPLQALRAADLQRKQQSVQDRTKAGQEHMAAVQRLAAEAEEGREQLQARVSELEGALVQARNVAQQAQEVALVHKMDAELAV